MLEDLEKFYIVNELTKGLNKTLQQEIKDKALEYMCRPGGELYLAARDHFSGALISEI